MNPMLRNALCLPAVAVTGTAFAADAVVTLETVAALPGTTAHVAVTIEASDLIGALDFDAFADGLTFADVAYDGPLFSGGWEGWDTTPSTTPSIAAACIFPEDQVTGLQELFTLEIEVPESARIGSSFVVDFTDALVTNYQFTQYDVTVVAGAIEIVDDGETPCPADLDGSGQVDVTDLVELIVDWGATGDLPEDLDDDGIVGVADLTALIAAWGACP